MGTSLIRDLIYFTNIFAFDETFRPVHAYHRHGSRKFIYRSRRHLGPPRSLEAKVVEQDRVIAEQQQIIVEQRATIASLREALNTAHEQITLLKKRLFAAKRERFIFAGSEIFV